jgi:hypothetical protein
VIDPSALLGLAGVPVTTALTELVKRAFPELPARFVPLVALAFSLALNVGLAPRLGVDVTTALVMGLVAGLAASGLYSAGKELRA